jgi:hypothetical protein
MTNTTMNSQLCQPIASSGFKKSLTSPRAHGAVSSSVLFDVFHGVISELQRRPDILRNIVASVVVEASPTTSELKNRNSSLLFESRIQLTGYKEPYATRHFPTASSPSDIIDITLSARRHPPAKQHPDRTPN